MPIASRKYELIRQQVTGQQSGERERRRRNAARRAARADGRKAKVGLGPNERWPKLSTDKFT